MSYTVPTQAVLAGTGSELYLTVPDGCSYILLLVTGAQALMAFDSGGTALSAATPLPAGTPVTLVDPNLANRRLYFKQASGGNVYANYFYDS